MYDNIILLLSRTYFKNGNNITLTNLDRSNASFFQCLLMCQNGGRKFRDKIFSSDRPIFREFRARINVKEKKGERSKHFSFIFHEINPNSAFFSLSF